MKYAQHFLLALLVSGVMVVPSMGQSTGSAGERSGQASQSSQASAMDQSGSKMTDHQFIKKAAEDDLAEIQMAQLAQQKASDNNLKQMAQHLMNDHQQNEQQIKQVAEQQGVTLPTQPDSKDKAKYDRLSKLNGSQFDKAFIREQLRDHQKDVAMFQHASSNAKDQAVKQYAANTLPKLQQHLEMVQSSAQQLGVSTGQSSGRQSSTDNNQQMK